MARTRATPPAAPAVPAAPALADKPAEPVVAATPDKPAEPVVAGNKVNVKHKKSGQKFEVSKQYYLRNKSVLDLCQ